MNTQRVVSDTGRSPMFLQKSALSLNMGHRRLVVIQLNGGNDGLNTIVPYRNDIYYNERPTLGIRKQKIIDINGDVGFNTSMRGIADLFHEGNVSVINKVGYPNASRSHFKSMDFWQSGGDFSSGWLGRYLDQYGATTPKLEALEVSDMLSLALRGENQKGMAFDNLEELNTTMSNLLIEQVLDDPSKRQALQNKNLEYVYNVANDSRAIITSTYEKYSKVPPLQGFPDTEFSSKLKTVAQMIISEIDTPIYYVSQGTYDTHVGQTGKHNKLLKEFSDGIAALVQALKTYDQFKNTSILVFSEFGRRVGENASKGTDHGAGNSMYLIGSNLAKPGFYNPYDNLQNLIKGDLPFEIDFRQIYAAIIEDWMQGDSSLILKNDFEKLNLFNQNILTT